MAGKQDLRLSLSLATTASFPVHHNSNLQLNLHKPPPPPSSWADTDLIPNPSSGPISEPTRSFLRGIDVNRLPPTATDDCGDDAGVSSPNSTISSVSGNKRSERDEPLGSSDPDADPASSGRAGAGNSDDEDGDTSRKKLRLSKGQAAVLEDSFKEHHTLNPKQKSALAKQLGLRPRQVEVWFQNRRARTKLKQTEVDCEFLKRCCENLTEENRRLQKEVQELRALKLSPQFYMHMTPPTTLTMCPSCERVGVPPSTSSSSAPMSAQQPPLAAHPSFMGWAHQHRPMTHVNPWAAVAAAAAAASSTAHAPLNLLRPRS